MSFVTTVNIPEGIVMAADSRQSITIEGKTPEGKTLPKIETVASDFVYKVFLLEDQKVGIATFGESILGDITVESHIKRFSEEKLTKEDVSTFAKKIVEFFREKFPKADTAFHVAGFKKEGKVSVPYIYVCHVSRNEVKRVLIKPGTDEVVYGNLWGGQGDIMASIIQPGEVVGPDGSKQKLLKPPILWATMTIQDAIDFAIYAVRTTIDTMRFQARPKNVGGPIDVLLLTPKEAQWIQRKEFHGEH